jgi:hypothetical protein
MRGLGWWACGLLVLGACQGCGGDSGQSHGGAPGASAAGNAAGPAGSSGALGTAGGAGQAGVAAAGSAGVAGTGSVGSNGGTAGNQVKDGGSQDSSGGIPVTDGAPGEVSADGSYVNPPDSEVWLIDNLQSIGGHSVSKVLRRSSIRQLARPSSSMASATPSS